MDLIKLINRVDIENLGEKKNNNRKCPECGSKENININSECVCAKCGLVLAGPNPYVGSEKIIYPYGLDLHVEW